ncbi:MAG: peptidoglycan-binding protein, partial [Alphaproteobacteria bacterium]|nr:peptidoglycan-binding protein [Alphaproteobacteria bacterium]
MTSANATKRFGIYALLLAGLIGFSGEVPAQSSTRDAATEIDQSPNVDRKKMRLKLLIKLVENELEEANLLHSRLTVEAAGLDQERRVLKAAPPKGTRAERRQLDVIDERLQQIDQEMAGVNSRLPEINGELAELQARLDEANGIVREPETDTVTNGVMVDGANRWLDGKRRVQEALVYLGGYNALIDGDFGPRTAEAVRVYQGRQNVEQTGTLTADQEAALLEEADLLRTRYGMKTIEDKEEGYRLSYPSGLLPEGGPIAGNGKRFVTKDGRGELLITSSNGDGGPVELSSLFDQLLADYDVEY